MGRKRLKPLEEQEDTILSNILEHPSEATPVGKLILKLNKYLSRPKIEDDLYGIMGTYLNYLHKAQIYLSHGVFNTNFAEGALIIQSASKLYAKKVDLLWDCMIAYQERLTLYEEKTDKTVTDKIEERKQRFKRKRKPKEKKINILFGEETKKSIDLGEMLSLLDEPNKYAVKDINFEQESVINLDEDSSSDNDDLEEQQRKAFTNFQAEVCKNLRDMPKVNGFNCILSKRDEDEDDDEDQGDIDVGEEEIIMNFKDSVLVHLVSQKLNYVFGLNVFHNIPVDEIKETDGYEYITNQYIIKRKIPIEKIYEEIDKYHASAKDYIKNFVQIYLSNKLQKLSKQLCPREAYILIEKRRNAIKNYLRNCNVSVDEELEEFSKSHHALIDKPTDALSETESGYFEGSEYGKTNRNTPVTPNRLLSPMSAIAEADPAPHNIHIFFGHAEEIKSPSIEQVQDHNSCSLLNDSGVISEFEGAPSIQDITANMSLDHTYADIFNELGCDTECGGTEDVQESYISQEHVNVNHSEVDDFNDSGVCLDSYPCTPNKTIIEELPRHKYTTRKRCLNFNDIEGEPPKKQKRIKVKIITIKLRGATTATLSSFEKFFYKNYTPENDEGVVEEPEYESDFDMDNEENNNEIEESDTIDNNVDQEPQLGIGENTSIKNCADNGNNEEPSSIPNDVSSPKINVKISDAQKSRASYREWRKFIIKKLRKQSGNDFDIHEEGRKIIDAVGEIGKSVKYATLCDGKPSEDVCKTFIAMLQLANTCNVEINNNIEPPQLANDTLELKLLSKEQHHTNIKKYNAPSEVSLDDRMSKVREAMVNVSNTQDLADFSQPEIINQDKPVYKNYVKVTKPKIVKRQLKKHCTLENLNTKIPTSNNNIYSFNSNQPATITNRKRKHVVEMEANSNQVNLDQPETSGNIRQQSNFVQPQSSGMQQRQFRVLPDVSFQDHVTKQTAARTNVSRREKINSFKKIQANTNNAIEHHSTKETKTLNKKNELGTYIQYGNDEVQIETDLNQFRLQPDMEHIPFYEKQRKPIGFNGNQHPNTECSATTEREKPPETSCSSPPPIVLNFAQKGISTSGLRQSGLRHLNIPKPAIRRNSTISRNFSQYTSTNQQTCTQDVFQINQQGSSQIHSMMRTFDQQQNYGLQQRQLNFKQSEVNGNQQLLLNFHQQQRKGSYKKCKLQ